MAKRKKGATITFEVTDNGTLKMLDAGAKKAARSTDKLGKSAVPNATPIIPSGS